MDVFKAAEKLMSMDEQAWARHANAWSVFSRIPALPLIALAIWSRVWIGWWCLLPLLLVVIWTWLNPRIFPPIYADDPRLQQAGYSWAYKGVNGERLFLNRKTHPVPLHHQRIAYLLTTISILGIPILGFGLYQLDFWATLCGLVVAVGAKIWFVDRMVWMYSDMKEQGGAEL